MPWWSQTRPTPLCWTTCCFTAWPSTVLPKNDPEFKKLIDEEMHRLIVSKEIAPNDKPLNLPERYLRRDFWKYPSDFVPL